MTTHVRRWHAHHHTQGEGHLYQGTYESFPMQDSEHFLTVCRYVERNVLRAGLVERAEHWRWCSAWRRGRPAEVDDKPPLVDWPVARPERWRRVLNLPQPQKQVEAIRTSIQRGRPLGDESWQGATTSQRQLESALRSRGRPRKTDE